jgi:hypothetical protein
MINDYIQNLDSLPVLTPDYNALLALLDEAVSASRRGPDQLTNPRLALDIIINLFILFQKYLLNFAASPAQKLVSIVMRRSIALAQVEGEAISY